MKVKRFLALVCAVLCLSVFSSSAFAGFYDGWYEASINGVNPFSYVTELDIPMYYRYIALIYNSKAQLKKITAVYPEDNETTTIEYSEDAFNMKYYSEGKLIMEGDGKYTLSGNTINLAVTIEGVESNVTYTVDASGKLLKAEFYGEEVVFTYDANGNIISMNAGEVRTFTYDSQNRLTSCPEDDVTITYNGSDSGHFEAKLYGGSHIETKDFTFNSQGNPVSIIEKADGVLESSIKMTYNSDGSLATIECYDEDGVLTSKFNFEYKLAPVPSSPVPATGDGTPVALFAALALLAFAGVLFAVKRRRV